ncbi:hypothetical protein OIU76_015172 [Salix suchowensis]|nr:hypothetical protein OIU76_015172 [Salix suchowensis]
MSGACGGGGGGASSMKDDGWGFLLYRDHCSCSSFLYFCFYLRESWI